MLSERTGKILRYIVEQYIDRAAPVPSQSIALDCGLGVSPATIRNEMVDLREAGYIVQPHISAGGVPSDKGYRYYVEALDYSELPAPEQRFISHLFHQVEAEIEQWLSLAASLLAQQVKNVAVISMPRQTYCKFKHMELLSLQSTQALAVVVLYGVKVKQKLVNFDREVEQATLTAVSAKLNAALPGLTYKQVTDKRMALSPEEQQIVDEVVEIMYDEDRQEYDDPYLDGLHYMFNQPEFARSDRLRNLMELVDQRSLLKTILPDRVTMRGVHVVIGRENKEEAIREYSVIISPYGLPGEATGTIGVVGPTRMPYSRTIPTVGYLSTVLSSLVAGLYGRETPPPQRGNSTKQESK